MLGSFEPYAHEDTDRQRPARLIDDQGVQPSHLDGAAGALGRGFGVVGLEP